MKMYELSDLEQEYPVAELLDNNGFGNVFRISDRSAVKVPRVLAYETDSEVPWILMHEYNISRKLHEKEFCVPEPFGVFRMNLRLSKYGRILTPVFVMEYIDGREIHPNESHLIDLVKREIKRAKELGFKPADSGFWNSIWCPNREKVYLIDFQMWN